MTSQRAKNCMFSEKHSGQKGIFSLAFTEIKPVLQSMAGNLFHSFAFKAPFNSKTLNILLHRLHKYVLYVLLVCSTKEFFLFHALLCWHWCLRYVPQPAMRPFKSTLLHLDTLISIPHWAVNTTFAQTIQCLVHLLKAQIHQWDSH